MDMEIRFSVKDTMERKKMTQAQLSRKSGVEKAQLSRLLNNKRGGVNLDYLERIAEALNTTNANDLIEIRK